MRGKKICFIVTVPFSARVFFIYYLMTLSKNNDVYLISSFDHLENNRKTFPGITIVNIKIHRKISILNDVRSLSQLYLYLKREQFDIVHTGTPKAGLLGMLAARCAKTPTRFHTFTGQVWATKTGVFRCLLKFLDKIIFRCATSVLIDSHSQREFLISEGVVDAKRSKVLGKGSFCGVDTARFKPDPVERLNFRQCHALRQDAFVYLFLGRLGVEKGISELISAFEKIARNHTEAILLLVGPDEGKMLDSIKQNALFAARRILYEGYTTIPEKFMAAADVLCLPSHREGFGSVIIEAAATGIPAIGSRIYGISDAIVDGETGLLHAQGDSQNLYECMESCITDRAMTLTLGKNARTRAMTDFSTDLLVQEFLSYYDLCSNASHG